MTRWKDFEGKYQYYISFDTAAIILKTAKDKGRIIKELQALIRTYLEHNTLANDKIKVRIGAGSKILPVEQYQEKIEKLLKDLEPATPSIQDITEKHPDDGKEGYWRINGIRHSPIVWSTTAKAAVEKALQKEAVGDWEVFSVDYLGERPEIIE